MYDKVDEKKENINDVQWKRYGEARSLKLILENMLADTMYAKNGKVNVIPNYKSRVAKINQVKNGKKNVCLNSFKIEIEPTNFLAAMSSSRSHQIEFINMEVIKIDFIKIEVIKSSKLKSSNLQN